MPNKDIMRCVSMTVDECKMQNNKSVHDVCKAATECIVKNALLRMTSDNVTVIMLAFKHFKDIVKVKLGQKEMLNISNKIIKEDISKTNKNEKTLRRSELSHLTFQAHYILRLIVQ